MSGPSICDEATIHWYKESLLEDNTRLMRRIYVTLVREGHTKSCEPSNVVLSAEGHPSCKQSAEGRESGCEESKRKLRTAQYCN